jgi:hypothetical protein
MTQLNNPASTCSISPVGKFRKHRVIKDVDIRVATSSPSEWRGGSPLGSLFCSFDLYITWPSLRVKLPQDLDALQLRGLDNMNSGGISGLFHCGGRMTKQHLHRTSCCIRLTRSGVLCNSHF